MINPYNQANHRIKGIQGVTGSQGACGIQGTQWQSQQSYYAPYLPLGVKGQVGTPGPHGIPNPKPTIKEWKPFFAMWPRKTINGKLRVGPLFRRTQIYDEISEFSQREKITVTRYATKKEVFVWKLRYNG